ncbi:MAG: aldehyde dehydrogenase family protein [Hyphomonadaceae bacterium]|nr:aldehyde dehydrogenase family protein [Hyphomonadaceae bacterium]
MKDFKLLIGGKLVAGASTLDVINPATEEVIAKCPRADLKQLNEAVAAAKAAFASWSKTSVAERQRLLNAFADGMQARHEEIARQLTEEQGKPLPHAMGEVAGAIGMTRYFASLELSDKVLRETDDEKIVQQFMPLGVVAAITPWNFPVLLLMLKLPPALVAGNTIVAKPAPTTPLTSLIVAEIAAQVFPAGVVNVICDGNDLGGALTAHPDVAKVAFTGSTATGKKVMESVSSTLKRLTLELGGNDAAIVLDDVDPKAVAPQVFAGATMNSGQVCLAIKRLYVHESQYDAMCEELAKCANEAIVDDGMKQGTQMGPIQNKTQYEKVLGYIESARKDGKIIAGGEKPSRKGYFIPPTIVRDIADDAKLVREEQFGPVLPVLRYTDVEDAVRRANDTDYGLGGTVWSNDYNRAMDVARKIESGVVWVNKHLDLPPDMPFGGAKQSGHGTEMGREGLEEFAQSKIINVAKRSASSPAPAHH